jgi:polyphosphate kinase
MAQERLSPTLASLLSQTRSPFIHRDLSWLQFNERVLGEARDEANPLLERAKFLGISSSNLDEFFMIRFSSLTRSHRSAARQGNREQSRTLEHIRQVILREVAHFKAHQAKVLEELTQALESQRILIVKKCNQDPETAAIAHQLFHEQIFPQLSPPEPFKFQRLRELTNLQMALIFPGNQWIPLPKTLPQALLHIQPDGAQPVARIFFLDELLLSHAAEAFGLPAESKPSTGLIRLTRDGDFTVEIEEEDTESIPDVVRTGIRRRDRGRPARLQYLGHVSEAWLRSARGILRLTEEQTLAAPRTLLLHGLWSMIHQLGEKPGGQYAENPILFYSPTRTRVPPQFKSQTALFGHLKERDILLHQPYDSFDSFVQWIQMSAQDPQVESIELTVYRTDAVSPVVQALKQAAKNKKIRVVIELRARFDELNNLRLAEELRNAGVEVHFGFGQLKLHAKIALVTRVEAGEVQRYTHLSTGNYNAITARQYTDLSILTSKPEIGSDARLFFDAVTLGKVPASFKKLLSAPTRMHRRILSHIEDETKAAQAGKKARIVAKVNALVDESVISSLYQASQAGVKVDLIVRGACSLIPGVKGLSENIQVVSIVDRYLEHSRIYLFESSRTIYLSSADWMPRNFFSRLELAYPVLDPILYRYLDEVLILTYLSDTAKARELTAKGTWKRRPASDSGTALRAQFHFQELADRGYQGTPLE